MRKNVIITLSVLLFSLFLATSAMAVDPCTPVTPGRFGCTFTGSGYQALTAGNINPSGDLVYYNGGDSPQGGWIYQGIGSTAGMNITLPVSLSSGTLYRIFLDVLGYDLVPTVSCTLGGSTSTTITVRDRSPLNEYHPWQEAMEITPGSTSAALACDFDQGMGQPNLQVLVVAIYITTDTSVLVDGSGHGTSGNGTVISLTQPVARITTVVAGNQITNGSFEAGLDAGFALSTNKVTDPASIWTCTAASAHTGSCGLTVPINDASYLGGVASSPTSITSRIFHLKANQRYKVSAWAKFDSGTAFCSMGMFNIFIAPGTTTPNWQWGSAVSVGTTWTEVATFPPYMEGAHSSVGAVGYSLKWPESDYYASMSCNAPGGATTVVYTDDWYLNEDTTASYTEALPLTCGVSTAKDGNIFLSGDTITFATRCYNSTGSPITKSLYWEIFDSLNARVDFGTLSTSTSAGATSTSSITSSALASLKGPFRFAYHFDSENLSDRELMFSIVENITSRDKMTSSLGIHPSDYDWQLSKWNRLGFKWGRLLSPLGIGQMNTVAPVSATSITFFDSSVAEIQSRGIEPLIDIFCNGDSGCPAYATSGGLPNITQFATFAGAFIDHYCNDIPIPVLYYEVWNEPSYSASFYAQLSKAVSDAAEAVCPGVKLVGVGGRPASYINSVIAQWEALYLPSWDWHSHYTILSGHAYPGGQPPFSYSSIITDENVPIWNTETGCWDLGYHRGIFSNFQAPGSYIYPMGAASRFYNSLQGCPNQITINYGQTMASGQSKYFNYAANVFEAPAQTDANFTIQNYDSTPKAKAVAYSIAGAFIDHGTAYGNVSANLNSQFLLFERDGVCVAQLLSSNNSPRKVTLSGSNSDYLLYDWNGNPVTFIGATIPYGRNPVYLKCNGITRATMQARLAAGLIESRADTSFPNVIVVDGPRAAITTGFNNFRMRWLGGDSECMPVLSTSSLEGSDLEAPNPDALLYRYRLIGYDSAYSDWAEGTYVDYASVPNGSYTFVVDVKDCAGNVTTSAVWYIGNSIAVPTLTSISPTFGNRGATVAMTLTGTNLNAGSAVVHISGTGVTINSTVVVNATTITCNFVIASGATTGFRNVYVSTVGGNTGNKTFEVRKPGGPKGSGRRAFRRGI